MASHERDRQTSDPDSEPPATESTGPGDHLDQLRAQLTTSANQGTSTDRIDVDRWAGGIEQQYARMPQIRIGKRWFKILWMLPIGAAAALVGVAVAQQLRTYPWMQEFIATFPGTADSFVPPVESGFPAWLRWQHFLNLMFMMFIMRAGLQILADHPRLYLRSGSRPGTEWMRLRGPVPADRLDPSEPYRVWTAKDDSVALPKWLGIPGFRHSIGLARWWHFSFDLLWVVNGIVFYILLFSTGQWQRLVPQGWDVFPNALSTIVQYLSLDFPANEGWTQYNGAQLLTYFITVFIAAPLAIITGLLQAPAIAGKFGTGRGPLNRQVARSIHFCVLLWFIGFVAVHVTMVFATGLIGNLNHITLGSDGTSMWALFWFGLWLGALIGAWLWASPFTISHPRHVQKAGRFLIGWLKGAMEWWDPRATYQKKDISPYLWPNGEPPRSAGYASHLADNFNHYALRIDGLVENPVELSLQQLHEIGRQEQITQHYCIQGWSGVAEWSGVPMRSVLEVVQPLPQARWVVFYSFSQGPDGGRYYDCHKIENMSHELTILAYEMNGEPLSVTHGAPLRLRDEAELGFKQVKWIEAIEFVDSFDHLGAGQGGYNEDHEFFGYRMPI